MLGGPLGVFIKAPTMSPPGLIPRPSVEIAAGIINGREIPAAQQKPMLLSTGVRVETHNLAPRTDVLSACGDSARKLMEVNWNVGPGAAAPDKSATAPRVRVPTSQFLFMCDSS